MCWVTAAISCCCHGYRRTGEVWWDEKAVYFPNVQAGRRWDSNEMIDWLSAAHTDSVGKLNVLNDGKNSFSCWTLYSGPEGPNNISHDDRLIKNHWYQKCSYPDSATAFGTTWRVRAKNDCVLEKLLRFVLLRRRGRRWRSRGWGAAEFLFSLICCHDGTGYWGSILWIQSIRDWSWSIPAVCNRDDQIRWSEFRLM